MVDIRRDAAGREESLGDTVMAAAEVVAVNVGDGGSDEQAGAPGSDCHGECGRLAHGWQMGGEA